MCKLISQTHIKKWSRKGMGSSMGSSAHSFLTIKFIGDIRGGTRPPFFSALSLLSVQITQITAISITIKTCHFHCSPVSPRKIFVYFCGPQTLFKIFTLTTSYKWEYQYWSRSAIHQQKFLIPGNTEIFKLA